MKPLAEVEARLREDDSPLGLAATESICPPCRLVFHTAAGLRGVCADCADA